MKLIVDEDIAKELTQFNTAEDMTKHLYQNHAFVGDEAIEEASRRLSILR